MIDQYQKKFAVISFDGVTGKFIGTFTELKVAEGYVSFILDLNPGRDVRIFEAITEKHGYPVISESEVHSD